MVATTINTRMDIKTSAEATEATEVVVATIAASEAIAVAQTTPGETSIKARIKEAATA